MTGSAHEIISAATTLSEGDKIVIRCDSYEEMETLRKGLYRVKNILMKTNKALAYSLCVSREVEENSWHLVVTKELTASGVVIVRKNGAVEALTRVEPAFVDGEDETDRMRRLMEQDGVSEEEIETALAEKGEQDFDAAASKIEEAQAAVSKKKKKGGE